MSLLAHMRAVEHKFSNECGTFSVRSTFTPLVITGYRDACLRMCDRSVKNTYGLTGRLEKNSLYALEIEKLSTILLMIIIRGSLKPVIVQN